MQQKDFRKLGCAECATGCDLGFDFTVAFQPIINSQKNRLRTRGPRSWSQ
ncbi:MAG: hypothetical protein ACI8Q3_001550 [Marinomonas primoryensis]|jgi:hypothetical protein